MDPRILTVPMVEAFVHMNLSVPDALGNRDNDCMIQKLLLHRRLGFTGHWQSILLVRYLLHIQPTLQSTTMCRMAAVRHNFVSGVWEFAVAPLTPRTWAGHKEVAATHGVLTLTCLEMWNAQEPKEIHVALMVSRGPEAVVVPFSKGATEIVTASRIETRLVGTGARVTYVYDTSRGPYAFWLWLHVALFHIPALDVLQSCRVYQPATASILTFQWNLLGALLEHVKTSEEEMKQWTAFIRQRVRFYETLSRWDPI